MASSQVASQSRSNKLLAALPKTVRLRLASSLEPVELPFEKVLYETDCPIRDVYFPTSGIISLLLLENGSIAEVGRVGNEGMIGLPVFFGMRINQTRAVVQIPGGALRMNAEIFQRAARHGGPFSGVLLRYAQALMGHTQRLTACNVWHSIEQRLCGWLLITHDRVQTDLVEVTQEFLAQMFGAHRQSVTLAASNLQRAGLIRYSRGKLKILDRKGLEAATCECYREIQRQYEQLHTEIDR